jgi:DNA repair ATPase RecN
MAKPKKDTPEIPDVEKEVKNLEELEDLSDVEVGLENIDALAIAASERYQCAISYQRLKMRADTVTASVKANKSVGNTEAVKKFEEQLKEITEQMMHCLRGIKVIDGQFPRAKKEMQKVAERIRQQG